MENAAIFFVFVISICSLLLLFLVANLAIILNCESKFMPRAY